MDCRESGYRRRHVPPLPVLIVDFENKSQDAAFQGALEQALRIAMEEAPFVTAYPRRDAARLVSELKLGDKLDEKAGMLVANREGIPVILAGSIEPNRGGYRIAVRAINPDKPDPPIAEATATAPDKSSVLGAVSRVAVNIRKGLGDTSPRCTAAGGNVHRRLARRHPRIHDRAGPLRQPEGRRSDPSLRTRDRVRQGFRTRLRGHGDEPLLSRPREDAAKTAWDKALKLIDRMSEREKLRTMGSYLRRAGAQLRSRRSRVPESLVTKYPADSAGHNNLAVAYFSTLNFAEGARATGNAPSRSIRGASSTARTTLSMRCTPGDFPLAAATAQELIKEDPKFETAYLPLAMEALASRDVDRARAAYGQAAKGSDAGASLASIGLADIAMFQGKNADADRRAARRDQARSRRAEHLRRRGEAAGAGRSVRGGQPMA